jgi:hypothetical protein
MIEGVLDNIYNIFVRKKDDRRGDFRKSVFDSPDVVGCGPI